MSPRVETLLLPLTQYRLQWREDGYWRAWPPDQWQHVEWADANDPDSWAAWTGEHWEGGVIVDDDRLLLGAYGEMPADGSDVTVTLTDGTPIPLLHVGKMWACEWSTPLKRFEVAYRGELLPVGLPPAPA